jgi:hypothetical protein
MFRHYLPILQQDVADLERIQFWVCAFQPHDIQFHVRGRQMEAGTLARDEKKEWAKAGGIVSYLTWQLDGFVSQPKTFCGRQWRLEVEDLDFHEIRLNGSAGILGSGYLDEDSGFRVQLQMPPIVTEGLLKQLKQTQDRTEPWRLRHIIDDCQEIPENPDTRNELIKHLHHILQGIEEQPTHPQMINIGFRVVNLRCRAGGIRETIEFDVAMISFSCLSELTY